VLIFRRLVLAAIVSLVPYHSAYLPLAFFAVLLASVVLQLW
jgi:hypothetical protein